MGLLGRVFRRRRGARRRTGAQRARARRAAAGGACDRRRDRRQHGAGVGGADAPDDVADAGRRPPDGRPTAPTAGRSSPAAAAPTPARASPASSRSARRSSPTASATAFPTSSRSWDRAQSSDVDHARATSSLVADTWMCRTPHGVPASSQECLKVLCVTPDRTWSQANGRNTARHTQYHYGATTMTTLLNDTIEAGDVIEIIRNGETISALVLLAADKQSSSTPATARPRSSSSATSWSSTASSFRRV